MHLDHVEDHQGENQDPLVVQVGAVRVRQETVLEAEAENLNDDVDEVVVEFEEEDLLEA